MPWFSTTTPSCILNWWDGRTIYTVGDVSGHVEAATLLTYPNFADPVAAQAAAPDRALILIAAGTYNLPNNWNISNRILSFVGIGNSPTDVQINCTQQTGTSVYVSGGTKCCMEHLSIDSSTTDPWQSYLLVNFQGQTTRFYGNRVNFTAVSAQSHALILPDLPSFDPDLTGEIPGVYLKNCFLDRGYNTVAFANLQSLALDKCHTPNYSTFTVVNTLFLDDKDTNVSAAANYGIDYDTAVQSDLSHFCIPSLFPSFATVGYALHDDAPTVLYTPPPVEFYLVLGGYELIEGNPKPKIMSITNIDGDTPVITTRFAPGAAGDTVIIPSIAVFEDGRHYATRGSFSLNNATTRGVYTSADGYTFIGSQGTLSIGANTFWKTKRRLSPLFENIMQFVIEDGTPVERIHGNPISVTGSPIIWPGGGPYGEDSYSAPSSTLPSTSWFQVDTPLENLGTDWTLEFDIKLDASDIVSASSFLFGSTSAAVTSGKGWAVYISGGPQVGLIASTPGARQYIWAGLQNNTSIWQRVAISRQGVTLIGNSAVSNVRTALNVGIEEAFDLEIASMYFGRTAANNGSEQTSHQSSRVGLSQVSNVRFFRNKTNLSTEFGGVPAVPHVAELNVPAIHRAEVTLDSLGKNASGAYINNGTAGISPIPETLRSRVGMPVAEIDVCFDKIWGGGSGGVVQQTPTFQGSINSSIGTLTWTTKWLTATGQANAPPAASGTVTCMQLASNPEQNRLGMLWARSGFWIFGWSEDGEILQWQTSAFTPASQPTELAINSIGTAMAISESQVWRCPNAMNAASTWQQVTLPGASGVVTALIEEQGVWVVVVRGTVEPLCQVYASSNDGVSWTATTGGELTGFIPWCGDMIRRLVPDYPAWTPAEITTDLWLDAADADTITTTLADNVSQWNDKSGNNRHFQQLTETIQPSRVVDGVHFVNADGIAFDPAITQRMESVGTGGGYAYLSVFPYMVYAVVDNAAGFTETNMIIGAGTDSGTSVSYNSLRATTTGGSLQQRFSGVTYGFQLNDVADWTNGQRNLVYGAWKSDSLRQLNVNASLTPAEDTRSSTSISTAGRTWLGVERIPQSGWGTPALRGTIREIIMVRDEDNKEKIEGYLAHKWNFAEKLPLTHPYRNEPPVLL